MVSKLAMDLLFEKAEPPVISLVVEIEGAIVGHIVQKHMVKSNV